MTSPTSPTSMSARARTSWFIAGIVGAVGPIVLFVIAGRTGPGPRTASLIYGIPALLTSALAIVSIVVLTKAGAKRAAIVVGIVALVLGLIAYFLWVNLAILGISTGDGPL